MNDFLTEKNKKAGVLGKLKWVLCGFCMLLSLGAIGASEKYIGEGRWGMAATEILLCLLFLYPTFREVQKELGKRCSKKTGKIYCQGIYPEYPDRQRRKLYYDYCTKQTCK